MTKGYHRLDLNGSWIIEGMDFEEGLARKAYEPTYQPQDPVPAEVPTIVQNALFAAGKIEDPYWEMNNEKILWIEEKEWWFFKEFTVPEEIAGRDYHLVFEGLTYRANIWLNGINIGNTEGMFLRHYLDVTKFIIPGKKNRLTLRLRALENSVEDRPGGKVKRGMVRSSGVVAPFTYWWNWSPHMVPIGIWKPVWLRVTGGARLNDPAVRTKIQWDECQEAAAAEVTASVEIESSYTRPEKVKLRGLITGVDFDGPKYEIREELTINPGKNTVTVETLLERPRLWWPNGLGEHPLYQLELWIVDEEGLILDRTTTEFGVRELKMVNNPDDEWVQEIHGQSNRLWSIVGKPYPWTFMINKKRVFIRGSNWLPVDNLFRLTEERYKLFLDQAEAANINMLRVWGGGIQETETFYRLCDRKGILTWAEFWLSCASYPVMPHDLFIRCAIDQIKCLRNHPSLVLWSGGNEYNPDEPENKELVDKLAAACAEYDPTRPFRRGSPYKGDRHGGLLMLPTRTSNKYNGDILNGDQRLTLFRAEVAVTRSAPLLSSIKKFIGEDKIWPIDRAVWQYHHAVLKEQERDAREYGATGSLERWLMATQLVHGQNHRHNMEYCRQTKYWCSGCMQWQLNGSWPSFHRELIDWYGVPKPPFYAYKRACQDYLVLADMEKYVFDANEEFTAEIYTVSDKQLRRGDCLVRAVIYDREMKVCHEQEGMVTIEADASAKAFTLRWRVPKDYRRKIFFLYLNLSQYGEVLAENFYWIGTSDYTRPDRCLNLNGYWEYQIGTEKKETKWQGIVMPAYWHKPPIAPPAGQTAFFRRKVTIPADWRGTELEMFCAGFEGNDEVYFNGVKIGATEEELTVEMGTDDLLFTEKWAERMAAEKGVEKKEIFQQPTRKGDKQNIRISSDPFVIPNLIKRFYTIPADKINWGGENILEVRLYGKHATGISEPVFIREVSTDEQKRAVIEFDNDGAYLADLSNLPAIAVEGEVFHDELEIPAGGRIRLHVHLRNNTNTLAFFTGVSLPGVHEVATEIYSDNYFALLPGTEKKVVVEIINNKGFQGRIQAQFEITGWNVETKKIGKPLDLNLL